MYKMIHTIQNCSNNVATHSLKKYISTFLKFSRVILLLFKNCILISQPK